MELFEAVRGDVDAMAGYWMLRKFMFLDWTVELFLAIVDPATESGPLPEMAEQQLTNMAYTEWLLFECEMRDGLTPLEIYIDEAPRGLDREAAGRLRQVAETQFFSRFEILAKDRGAGVVVLRDVRTGERYDVVDPHVCGVDRWRDGTIAERIGRVDGCWMVVGQMHLYDRALPSDTVQDGPGELHPEDAVERPYLEHAGYFLRLVRDVMGVDGRYRETMRAIAKDGPVS